METIFKNPKLKSQNGRNAFDRSQHRVWHSPFGALLPCFCKRVNPDDYVELSIESQTICDKLIRPAFIRLKEHINWYFIPDNMLWMPFDNFITGQDNYFSLAAQNIQEGVTPNSVPMFNKGFMSVIFSLLSSRVDINGFSRLDGALRLLDLLGYGNYYPMCQSIEDGGGYISANDAAVALGAIEPMNFFALLAYQKVYYDYYRNPKYEENNTKAYNIDDVKGGTVLDGTDTSGINRFLDIFQMHYAWAKKDYFTDVQPSILPSSTSIGFSNLNPEAPVTNNVWSIFGVPGASRNGVIAYQGNSTFTGSVNQNDGNRVSLSGNTSATTGPTPYNANTVGSAVQTNVSALRFAFAYDKLLRRMREAGGTFDAQMLAQFGIVPYDQRHGKCIYLGGQTNRLNASDVTDVANNLGFLGGQLNCYNPARTTSKYHVKDHGVIIGIYNTSLEFDYPSYGVERDNLAKYRFDWFNPEFENLGLQPTFRMELLNISQDAQDDNQWNPAQMQDDPNLRDIIGYSLRYQEYKTSIDRVYGLYDFGSGDVDRQAWVSQYYPFVHKLTTTTGTEGKNVAPFNKSNMVFTPLMFNQVLSVNDDSGWITDPFNHNQYIHFKCISNMSSLGEVF